MAGISEGLHAKMSALARRMSTSTTSYFESTVVLTQNVHLAPSTQQAELVVDIRHVVLFAEPGILLETICLVAH
jgi:hypothetical protein